MMFDKSTTLERRRGRRLYIKQKRVCFPDSSQVVMTWWPVTLSWEEFARNRGGDGNASQWLGTCLIFEPLMGRYRTRDFQYFTIDRNRPAIQEIISISRGQHTRVPAWLRQIWSHLCF